MGEKPMTPSDLIEWHLRRADTADANGLQRDLAFHEQAAACIREMVAELADAQQKREGLEEDLYQAVLVAYRRGAVEWTMLNYPQWLNAISAGREVCPPAPGAEA